MYAGDTIIAVASPPGCAARGLIRISGAATREVLGQALDGGPRPFDRGCHSSRLILGHGRTIPVLVAVFRGPASYTGEDSAELLLPGNPVLLDRVVARLCTNPGVRPAGPGEFSARAYLNERLSLAQAEGIAGVIAAQTREQLEAARAMAAGRSEYARWADELATLLALVEAGIDFTDQEDVVPIAPAALRDRLRRLRREIADQLGGDRAVEAATHLPRVVLAGAPNAGKSTLFNALLGRRRAVVSQVAGTTRDALEERLDLAAEGSDPVLLVDIAGLEERAAREQDAAREAIARAEVVVHCDPSGRFAALAVSCPVIRVRTKADQPGSAGAGAMAVCALDGWGLAVLRRAIADSAMGSRSGSLCAVLPRHRRALIRVLAGLAAASAAISGPRLRDPELVAGSLREALDALGELVGRISPDDVIGRVFATFCVGK